MSKFVRRKEKELFRVMAWKKNRVRVGKKQAENERGTGTERIKCSQALGGWAGHRNCCHRDFRENSRRERLKATSRWGRLRITDYSERDRRGSPQASRQEARKLGAITPLPRASPPICSTSKAITQTRLWALVVCVNRSHWLSRYAYYLYWLS